jgi:hypothetical protein
LPPTTKYVPPLKDKKRIRTLTSELEKEVSRTIWNCQVGINEFLVKLGEPENIIDIKRQRRKTKQEDVLFVNIVGDYADFFPSPCLSQLFNIYLMLENVVNK